MISWLSSLRVWKWLSATVLIPFHATETIYNM
uniref:Transcription factor bHLH130 isoform X1 n=1 Tax=Rhizophora mucronata TaxID=61149 RepID=A0A2P2INA4_RHIMU